MLKFSSPKTARMDFRANGYCLLKRGTSTACLDQMRKLYAGLRSGIDVPDIELMSAQFSGDVVDAVRSIIDDEPMPLAATIFQSSPYPKHGSTAGLDRHTHDRELLTEPPGRLVLAWTALFDVHPDDGPMWIAPGSHLRTLDLQSRLYDRLTSRDPSYFERLRDLMSRPVKEDQLIGLFTPYHHTLIEILDEDACEVEPILVQAGDTLLFHPSLVHGTMRPARTGDDGKSLPRPSCLVRYAGASCRFFVNAPWERQPTLDGDLLLTLEAIKTPAGRIYKDYPAQRLKALNVVRSI